MSQPVTRQDGRGVQGYDPAEVRARTREVLAALRCPAGIPDHFDALRASDRELLRYGLPPRPDPDLRPAQYDMWERMLRAPMRSVVPEFSVTGVVHLPAAPLDTATSTNWSGAIVGTSLPNETFDWVTGAWVVPNAWPPSSAQNDNGWNDGTYYCSTWVGIDGWTNQEILQGGTTSQVVVSGGNITSQTSYAWSQWYPSGEVAFSDPAVNPGDLVSFLVLAQDDNTAGSVTVRNVSSGLTSTNLISTAPGTSKLPGATAEWITEDPMNMTNQLVPMANYGAAFFFNAQAGSNSKNYDVGDAFLVNMVSGTATLSTAYEQGQSGLLTLCGTV